MYVYLVQHASAMSEHENPERPLTDKGFFDAKKVAAFIAAGKSIAIGDVMHSGKLRARQTAEILAGRLHPTRSFRESDGLNPMDDPAVWAKRLESKNDDIMLVGHLPHLGRLASLLLGRSADTMTVEFKNAGMLCLGSEEPGNWTVRWMIVPGLLP